MRSFEEWCEWAEKGVPGTVNGDTCELESGNEITREEFNRDWTEHISEGWNGESVDVEFWNYDPERISRMIDADEAVKEDLEDAYVASYVTGMKMYGRQHKSGLAHPAEIDGDTWAESPVRHHRTMDDLLDQIQEDANLSREEACGVGSWSYMFGVDDRGDVHTFGVGDMCRAAEEFDGTIGVVWTGGEGGMDIVDRDGEIPELSGDINISNTGEWTSRGF